MIGPELNQREAMAICAYDGTRYRGTCPHCGADNPRPTGALPAQLDMDGGRHEIAPASERLRLFEPVPVQLPGQLDMGELS